MARSNVSCIRHGFSIQECVVRYHRIDIIYQCENWYLFNVRKIRADQISLLSWPERHQHWTMLQKDDSPGTWLLLTLQVLQRRWVKRRPRHMTNATTRPTSIWIWFTHFGKDPGKMEQRYFPFITFPLRLVSADCRILDVR